MRRPVEVLGLYLHLARASLERQRPQVRDRLLVLAGAGAARLQLDRISDHCRRQILAHNPHHLVGRWPSLRDALADPDFLVFLKQLQRRYPLEKVERMLASLEIDTEGERDQYDSDEQYAAALLGLRREA